jgi:glycosyltransferase involved in cell wall biosynthesis
MQKPAVEPRELAADTAAHPVVSVVIPVYRSERYVAATLRSVLAQTFTDFEVIVVDDGSPDRSIAICKAFDDPRIRYVHQSNAGLAAARNAGIRNARGDYIAFIDSDDLWAPEKLERHVAHLRAAPEVGVSYSLSAFIDEDGAPLGSYQMLGGGPLKPVDCFVRNPIGNGSNAVVRAALFRETPPAGRAVKDFLFDEDLRQAEDYELWVRIATLSEWRIERLPWPLTYYRINRASLSADTVRQRQYYLMAIDKIAAYAPDLVRRHRPRSISNMHWYLARNLILQGDTRQAAATVGRAWHSDPLNIRLYQLLLLGALLSMWLLPADWHARGLRQAQRLYGRCQEAVMRWQQSGA